MNALLADYAVVDGEPLVATVKNISPYLVEARNFVVDSRATPISVVPEAMYGCKPADGGHLVLSDEEKIALLKIEPGAEKFVRPLISAEEFLHRKRRSCLWLKDVKATELKQLPNVRDRMGQVKKFRAASTKEQTRELTDFPGLFAEVRQPTTPYIVIPRHSSEARPYIPLGVCQPTEILSDSCASVPNATLYHFGVLMSAIHMAWVKTVCGRLESRYRYSNSIVYNNFPWPDLDKKSVVAYVIRAQAAIEIAAQAVLDARALEAGATLADLYNPPMPEKLLKAHRTLDAAVDAAYALGGGKKTWKLEAERVAYLFTLYKKLTSL